MPTMAVTYSRKTRLGSPEHDLSWCSYSTSASGRSEMCFIDRRGNREEALRISVFAGDAKQKLVQLHPSIRRFFALSDAHVILCASLLEDESGKARFNFPGAVEQGKETWTACISPHSPPRSERWTCRIPHVRQNAGARSWLAIPAVTESPECVCRSLCRMSRANGPQCDGGRPCAQCKELGCNCIYQDVGTSCNLTVEKR